MFRSYRMKTSSIFLLGFIVIMLLGSNFAAAQALPVFRIGILDEMDGSLTRGAQLAISEINHAGGIMGADGTIFQLQLVIQSPEDIDFAVSNINQARVIAVLGPADSGIVLGSRNELGQLGVPILTAATDDTLIVNDQTERLFRIRAQELTQGQALANYLISDLSAVTIATVQTDLESTVSVVGFKRALSQLGIAPVSEYILSETTTLQQIVLNIVTSMPQFVAVYGSPGAAAELYTELRNNDWPGGFVYNRSASNDFRSLVPENILEGVIGVSTWSYTFDDEKSQAFLQSYIRTFGSVPDDLAASAYDSIYLLQAAISRPGSLQNNLLAIRGYEGVQGVLSPGDMPAGEISHHVAITRLGEYGAPVAVARFAGTERIPLTTDIVDTPPTPTPAPLPSATLEGVFVNVTRAVQNVRTGPGLNYDILGQLQEGDQARVIGATVDFSWVAIDFRGTTGWLSRGILDLTGDTTTVRVLTPPPTPTPLPVTATPSPQPIPDIVVVAAQPNRLIIGAPFTVTATVRNQGGADAGPFAVAATFEPGAVYSAANLPGMLANTQTTITLSGVLSGATGPQNVTIVADLNSQVNEGAGEGNNFTFLFSYIADAPLLTTAQPAGTITLPELGTAVLDGGSQDVQWGGGGLVPLGATQLVNLTGFSSIDQVHRDAIASAALANLPITSVTPGQLIGIRTDGGQKYGVLQVVSAQAGAQISFNFRMYDN